MERMVMQRKYVVGGLAFVSLLVALHGCAGKNVETRAQATPADAATETPLTPAESAAAGLSGQIELRDARMGPGDEVALAVYRHPDLDRTMRVPASGVLFVPLVGELRVQDMSALELRRELTRRLDQYIVNPQVDINIVLNRSEKLMVFGEVPRPGVYLLNPPMRALEGLLLAGGYTNEGSERRVILLRYEGGQLTTRVLNIERAIKKGDWNENPHLVKGDVLFVPKSTVTEIDRVCRHLSTWLNPILSTEYGIQMGWDISDRFGTTGVYKYLDLIP